MDTRIFRRPIVVRLSVASFVALAIAATAFNTGYAQDSILRTSLDKQWPAPVTPANELPAPELPLTPAEAMEHLTLAPGYQLELVAAEPLVKDPILAEFDGDGRMWVLELHAFAYHPDMENSFEPINELVILEDTDGDTVFDKRTVFMDNLILPRAFKILDNNCALVGAPPNVFHACDTDGDLMADTRDVIETTFSEEGIIEHGANGLYWGMDNTLYVSEHEWNMKWRGAKDYYTVPSLRRGQWGVTQDNAGRIYRNVNTDPLFVDYISPQYYARNPNLIRTIGLYENLVNQDDTQIWPARPNPGLNRGYRTEARREDGSSSYYGGVSSPMIYRGDRLPEELAGQALVVDGPTNIVHLLNLKDDGQGNLSADDFYEKGEFIASTDERFRPVQLVPGWDGTFYVIDMYRGVSQDGPLQTDYLRNYINERKLWEHINLGRIYRVTSPGWKPDEKPSMSDDSVEELVAHLSHPNGWWRDTAQQLLIQRADASVVPQLRSLASESSDQNARLQALWTLSGLQELGVDGLDRDLVLSSLNDEWWAIRAAGLRLSEHWLREGNLVAEQAVLGLMNDEHQQVRRQLVASIGEIVADRRLDPLLEALQKYGSDAVIVDVAVSGAAGLEQELLDRWLTLNSPNPDVAGMLVGAIAKPQDVATVQALLATVTQRGLSEEIRIAMLDGMRLGLEGADGRQSSGVVAGGRAGSRPPGMRSERAPSVQIDLLMEPVALNPVGGESDALLESLAVARAVIGWPGKPRELGRDRTDDEQALYVIGSNVYSGLCAGCHGTEGQGVGGVGAALAGSRFVTGNEGVLARILLHGKEGSIGLMPPVASFSDEELAGVMTYIRGSFGNIADPVNEIAMKEYRQAYTFRDTPWTEEELAPAR